MTQELDIAYTESVAAELALRLAITNGRKLNDIADNLEQIAEVTRYLHKWESEADRQNFDCRR